MSVSEKMGRRIRKKKGVAEERKCAPWGEKIARIVRAAGSLFIVAEGSPVRLFNGYFEKPNGTSAFLRRCGCKAAVVS